MKQFLLLHIGFVPPTPEIMEKWNEWFASIADQTVAQQGFMGGKEISASGTVDLPWDKDAFTGFNIIEAESMEAAVAIAKENPFISSIRVYELRPNEA